MKREAIGHTKMKRLCRRLDIPLWQGVGLLESIWNLTGREAPRGDIGKLSDDDIGLALDYRGDMAGLIDALVFSGWLDNNQAERLTVHDWHEHCDDAVNMRLARHQQFFVGGHKPKLTRLPKREREAAEKFYLDAHCDSGVCTASAQLAHVVSPACDLPEPEPVPEPVPEPAPEPHTWRSGVRAADMPADSSARFFEFWELYPRKQRRDFAATQWLSLVTVENEASVFECLRRYLQSDEVRRGVIANPDRWIYEQCRNGWAGDWPAARVNASKQASIDREWEEIGNGRQGFMRSMRKADPVLFRHGLLPGGCGSA